MSGREPEGWDEVFRGPCLEADLIQAVLEARGLQVVPERLETSTIVAGLPLDQCRLFVRSIDGDQAREVLSETHEGD